MSFKGRPKISVLMSTYNRRDFLPRSIESILSQSYADFELILINNGCTDGSEEICYRYARLDRRIKLEHIRENRGAPAAKNLGLAQAAGEFITIVDDDDCCEKEMLAFLWELQAEYQVDISMCGSWNESGGKREPYFVNDDLLVLDRAGGLSELLNRKYYNVAPPTKLFRKSLFKGLRFIENVLVDDIHVIYKVFANANSVAVRGVPLYAFTKHGGNMTGFLQTNRLTPELLDEYLAMYRERTKYLSVKVPEVARQAQYSEWSYMLSMCDKINRYQCCNCDPQVAYMRGTVKANFDNILSSPYITEKDRALAIRYGV